MAISLTGLDLPFSAPDLISQLYRDFIGKRDARMQALLDGGIALERISFVTRTQCEVCHGDGWALRSVSRDASQTTDAVKIDYTYTAAVEIYECPECPGICVDGKPIARGTAR